MIMGDIITEKDKIFFTEGDVVKLKGTDDSPSFKVIGIEFKRNEDGSFVRENGKKKIDGVKVFYFTTIEIDGQEIKDTYIERVFDSRSIYKVEHTVSYYLFEAKKQASLEGKVEVVKLIDEALSYSNINVNKK